MMKASRKHPVELLPSDIEAQIRKMKEASKPEGAITMEINLRADQEAHLKQLCAEMGRTVDDFAGEAILTFMEDYEDGRDAQAALKASGRRFTLEEMEQEFRLDHPQLENHEN